MTDVLGRKKSRRNGHRQPVTDLAAAGRVIDALAFGVLRASADITLAGSRKILGGDGQELMAQSLLMQLPDEAALERVINRVGAARLAGSS